MEIEPAQSTQAVFERAMSAVDGQISKQGSVIDTGFEQSLTVEEYVRKQFTNSPIMAEIARCESEFRHFGKNGDIIRGEENSSDIGVMQINEYYHSKTADRFGINLYTLEGNIEYSKYLYEKYGTSPWNASSKCWSRNNHIAKK